VKRKINAGIPYAAIKEILFRHWAPFGAVALRKFLNEEQTFILYNIQIIPIPEVILNPSVDIFGLYSIGNAEDAASRKRGKSLAVVQYHDQHRNSLAISSSHIQYNLSLGVGKKNPLLLLPE
jgi:hypothetical protein